VTPRGYYRLVMRALNSVYRSAPGQVVGYHPERAALRRQIIENTVIDCATAIGDELRDIFEKFDYSRFMEGVRRDRP
jgi:hypothetical protein